MDGSNGTVKRKKRSYSDDESDDDINSVEYRLTPYSLLMLKEYFKLSISSIIKNSMEDGGQVVNRRKLVISVLMKHLSDKIKTNLFKIDKDNSNKIPSSSSTPSTSSSKIMPILSPKKANSPKQKLFFKIRDSTQHTISLKGMVRKDKAIYDQILKTIIELKKEPENYNSIMQQHKLDLKEINTGEEDEDEEEEEQEEENIKNDNYSAPIDNLAFLYTNINK